MANGDSSYKLVISESDKIFWEVFGLSVTESPVGSEMVWNWGLWDAAGINWRRAFTVLDDYIAPFCYSFTTEVAFS